MKRHILLLTLFLSAPCFSGEVTIPPGTTFFGVMTSPITSSPGEFQEHQIVKAQIYEALVIQG